MLGFASAFAARAEITLSVPADGGTPRDPARIERVGPREFRIRAQSEQIGTSLRHAVSRVDVTCHNSGAEAATVTLHLDLSDGGQRTGYDNRPEGGMPLRDFLFIQPPGKADWRQVNGKTQGWVATVGFSAEPGDTKVGLSPWYTYEDFLRFVQSLPTHPHLARSLQGRSDGGREHWELTITDSTVAPDQKRRVYWHAREHAYETYSSFAMEGLVEYLLSPGAAEIRRQYVISLHPLTNVDGVAEGYEYRRGYDIPQPRATATARWTFEAMDRLRPDFAVAWHNWIAPRDRDVVFYTDGEQGKATTRAWHLFTQRFPSPRAVDHRWRDEAAPGGRYNWHGRMPLSLGNVHQYAMKQYGTRVWGWEMPWWNRTTSDARRAGADFARAWFATLAAIAAGAPPEPPEVPAVSTPRWERHEFAVQGRAHVPNPFRETALVGEFTAPSGKVTVLDGFYDGGDTWRLRFAPDEEGEWRYLLRGEGFEAWQRGRLRCTPARSHGFIRTHPENPYAFAHADGTPFFPMGDTCYGLYDDSTITPELRAEYLRTRRAQHFNFVRMSVGHSQYRAAIDPAYWAWGGSAAQPDFDRLNPVFFRGLDELLRQMGAVGMKAELILLNLYRTPFTNPAVWTPDRERFWLRYLVARYGAFDNVFLFTIANEYETHPDGKYRLDLPDDVDWAKATARFIKEHDAHRHLLTIHPVVSASARGASPRDPIDPPWRIGEFFGESDAIDVLSQQTGQSGDGVTWSETLQCWIGDDPFLVASLAADRGYRKPVLNTESGYEYLRGFPTEQKQVHHTDKVRRSSWRIVSAGGYLAAGFVGTIGHSDVRNRKNASGRYTFMLKDEGAGAQLGYLHDFFTALPFWRMQPFAGVTGDAVALAEVGRVYAIYLPHGGAVRVDLTTAAGSFTARWFNPRTGKPGDEFRVDTGAARTCHAPDSNDWALRLEKENSQK